MSRSLRQILRLREVEEENCRLRLATEYELLAGIEIALSASQKEKKEARSIIFLEISSDLLDGRVLAEGISQIAQLSIDKLKNRRSEQQAKVALGREQYLESHINRLQLGRLLSNEERARNAEEVRRQQSALDDWFNNSKRRCRGSDVAE